jgi:comEA protein
VERYTKLGAKVYRTDQSGTLHIESDGKSFNIVEEFKDGTKSHKNSKKKSDVFKEKININKANLKDLRKIPLVGFATAKKIIEYREKNGPFKSISGIKKVRGIGTKLFNRIKKYMVIK